MTNQNLETRLRQAVTAATPDVLDSVLADCGQQKGTVVYMENKKKTNWARRVAGIAAALVLIVGCTVGFGAYRVNHAVASTISLDINPSIEITVNRNEKVLAVTPLNEDGRIVIGDMDFEGSDIDVTVNALIGSMLRNGYLSDIANSILVSVDNADPAAAAALQQRLTEEISGLLETDQFTGAVLSQTVAHDDADLRQLAETYGITEGKAALIRQLTAQNTLYSFESLAALSINELNLLSESGSIRLDSVSSVGTASDKGYIGRDAALAAAMSHAGIAQADARGTECELDFEHGAMVYEIEFTAAGTEYDYDIDAVTGAVVYHHTERDDDYFPPQTAPAQPAQPQQPTTPATPPAEYITPETALAAALSHAGVAAASARVEKTEFDFDDGIALYEVEFYAGGYEYDYEIDAVSGAVIKYSHEPEEPYDDDWDDDDWNAPILQPTQPSGQIGEDAALAAALSHAGLSAADVSRTRVELDHDDGRTVYEVEFQSGRYEYEYEIDAFTGSVLKSDCEYDD